MKFSKKLNVQQLEWNVVLKAVLLVCDDFNIVELSWFYSHDFTANNISTTTHRPYHKATTTTTRVIPTTIATTEAPSNKKDNDCPGVCVADRIADYCEAYLKTPNLCKPSTKCCVAKDSYLDNPDLRVLIGTQNSNNKTPLKPQKTSEKVCVTHMWKNSLTNYINMNLDSFTSK